MTYATMRTPCVRECCVDGQCGLCIGCGRTLKEIVTWTKFTDAERDSICDQLRARMVAAGLNVREEQD